MNRYKMRRMALVTLTAMLIPLVSAAQVSKEARKEAQRIQASTDYYWGLGTGSTQDEASRTALVDLQSKIYVFVKSNVETKIGNTQTGQEVSSTADTNVDIETKTGGVLTNTETMILSEEPEWRVMRYVKRKDVEDAFRLRVTRVTEYLQDGRDSERKGRIDNALRYYYWAYCLLRSLPRPDEITFKDEHFDEQRTLRWIPRQLDHIFENIQIEASTIDDSLLNLVAKYDNERVTSLDVSYKYGEQRSPLVSLKDGIAQIVLPKGIPTSLEMAFEYAYTDRSQQDSEELQMLIPYYKDAFPEARTSVKLGNKKEQKAVQKTFQASVEEVSTATNAMVVKSSADNDRTVKAVLDAIRTRKYNGIASYFTAEGYDMFQKIIAYGNARLLGQPNLCYYEGADGRVVCRSIPMNFAFKNNHITFTEEVVLTFNPEGKIESLAFAIDNATREEVFNKPSKWSPEVRMAIVTFLENYKTAFALKRLDYIRSIFDDYAIIVTGTVTMKSEKVGDAPMRLRENVKYTTFNKEQYLERLEKQFAKNQYINLRFTDVSLKQISNEDDFALRIKQDYFSSNYADTGYLFLMVDMNDSSKPLIKLRTWQPHRDPDVNAHLPENNPFYGLLYEGNFE